MSAGKSKPLVGFGPVIEYARKLQAVRRQTFRDMAKKVSYSPSLLSQVANDRALPNWPLTKVYLKGCGIPDEELEQWKQERSAAETAAQRFVPSGRLGDDATMTDLATELHDLVTSHGLDLDEVSNRLSRTARAHPKTEWAHPQPSAEELVAVLVEHARPLTPDLIRQVVRASGGVETDVRTWRRCWDLADARGAVAPEQELAKIPGMPPTLTAPEDPAPSRSAGFLALAPAGASHSRRQRCYSAIAVATISAAIATVVVVHIVVNGAGPRRTQGGRPDTVTVTCPTPPAVGPVTARDDLLDLCQRVQKLADPPSTGRYTYTRVRIWSVDTTPTRTEVSRTRPTRTSSGTDGPESVQDERLWWAEDHSGIRRTIIGDGNSSPDPQVEHFRRGELHIAVDRPSSDPTILIGQLEHQQPAGTGPAGRLRAVADINDYHLLDPAQRATILRVLADTEGLTYRGRVSDRNRRTGIAISADSSNGTVRDTLLFDDDSGQLLSHERVEAATGLDQPDARPVVTSYMLYVERGRTDSAG
jgi:hypothetical protein